MDDESGELMELVEEVPLEELGDAEVEGLVRGWRRVGSRDEGKHTGRYDLLFVEKMMWTDGECECDQRWRASAARRLNCYEVMQIWRLGGCENFVGKWEELYSMR